MTKTIERTERFRSIYTHKRDKSIDDWLHSHPGKIETIDKEKVSRNFELLSGKTGHLDKRARKFCYKTPIESIVNEFESNRKDFYMSVIKNKKYKIADLRAVIAHKEKDY